MEEQDYLKKGKQMENLYKDRISKLTLEVNHQLDTVDILCSQKIKSDYSDFSLSDNCFVNIDDIASKVERYIRFEFYCG